MQLNMTDTENRNYLVELNEQQREAVLYTDGPQLVIAGAGSGKTRVLTYKIMHLLSLGYEPYRILALTFTNKAAREMKERISTVAGSNAASKLWMGTFHSIFLRILRTHAESLGFKRDFTIYDASDSKSLISTIIKDNNLDDKVYKPSQVQAIISNAKNSLINAHQYAQDAQLIRRDANAERPMIYAIFKQYEARCRIAQAMDFDDILYYMNVLLRDFPDIKRHYQDFFRYILVDEYQDTNFAQHLIIKQLAGEHPMLCAVGDDAQSIYSFRGANINNILTLEKRYKGLQIFKLERNYRSTKNIVSAAGSLIEKNRHQIAKKVYSENETGTPVEVISTYSDMEEAALVANSIMNTRLIAHDKYSDYAVLYRTNAQSRVLEEALRKRNIPYRIYGGLSFYQRKEIKDAVCYFRLTVNPSDDEALQRVINYPARGIGQTTVKKIREASQTHSVPMFEIVSHPDKYNLNVHSGTLNKLNSFATLMKEFIDMNVRGESAYAIAERIYINAKLLSVSKQRETPEEISRRENLSALLGAVKEFSDERTESGEDTQALSDFLSEVSLATDQDKDEEDNEPKVTLMTVHAAKGLEFGNVFIVGTEEDLFPSQMSQSRPEEIEEERRLLYVAITRAMRRCTLTYSKSRFRNGQTVSTRPSRFLSDISPRFLHIQASETIPSFESGFINPLQKYRPRVAPAPPRVNIGMKPISNVLPTSEANKGSLHEESELKEGMRIVHHRFGPGIIVSKEKGADGTFIYVDFKNTGRKKLMLRFAKFDIID